LIVALPVAALGTLASIWAVRQVLALAAADIPRAERVSLNLPVLGFTLAVAIGCAVFFSLAPLWQARRTSPNEALSDGSRATAGARSHRLLRIFVVAEMALAFGLAAIGGLLLNQLSNIRRVQPGFDPNHVLTLTMNTPTEKYREEQQRIDYDGRLVEAIRAIPGVESAGFGWRMPLLGAAQTTMWHDGQPEPECSKAPYVVQDFISPDYFRAMGIPLLEGRFYTDADREDPGHNQGKILPLIINQAAARFTGLGAILWGRWSMCIPFQNREDFRSWAWSAISAISRSTNPFARKSTSPFAKFPGANGGGDPLSARARDSRARNPRRGCDCRSRAGHLRGSEAGRHRLELHGAPASCFLHGRVLRYLGSDFSDTWRLRRGCLFGASKGPPKRALAWLWARHLAICCGW
jgi:hypothetical protein